MNGDQTVQSQANGQASTAAAPPPGQPPPGQPAQASQPLTAPQIIAELEGSSDETIRKQPASFGMRVATQDGVKAYEQYLQNGGDPEQIPIYDRLGVAIAKDPQFLTRHENVDAYRTLVEKPLEQQSWGQRFNQALENIGPTISATVVNTGKAVLNQASMLKDDAELSVRKALGLTHDPGYETLQSRLATEMATGAQGTGQAAADAWNFVSGVYNGVMQVGVRPVAQLFANDPKSRDEIDRQFAFGTQDIVSSQQQLSKLGKTVQDGVANTYKAIGSADMGQRIGAAQPEEGAVQGYATVLNPLNYIGAGAGEAAVGAFKPVFFEKATQAIEEAAGANARKFVLDSTQILPKEPNLSAADPAYIPTRNLQVKLAPVAQQATQDAADASNTLAQRLTSVQKIAGDPSAVTAVGSQILQGAGTTLEGLGDLAKKATSFPEEIGKWVTGGHPTFGPMVKDFIEEAIFGGVLEHLGPLAAASSAVLKRLPAIADNFSSLLQTAGKELMFAETNLPFWQRVAQKTDAMPKFLAKALDSPLVQVATTGVGGGIAGAATGGVLGGLAAEGSRPGAGVEGMVSGIAQGGILGAAGAGLGQIQKFRDPNQYLLQARGDWQRYRSFLSPQELQNFQKLSPQNQLMLAQYGQHYPALKVNYINSPTGPAGFHSFDAGGSSNITVNLANPSSVIRGIMAHELIHGTAHAGMLPDLYGSLFGDPKKGITGQFQLRDAAGNPVTDINPETGYGYANQDFNNLKAEYINKMQQQGLPTSHLTDLHIAKEIYAEHGVDYLLSGQAVLDSNSAYRPILTSTNALKTAMMKIGYTFDENGKMIGAPGGSPYVQGTGLFQDLARVPKATELAQKYFQQSFRDGAAETHEQPTHRFTKKDMQNPNTSDAFLNTAAEIKRNPDGTAVRDPLTGQPIYRTPNEVKEYNAQFAQAVRSGLDTLPDDQRAALNMRQTEEGNTFLRYLPDSVLDSLAATNQYNPNQIAALRLVSRVLADAGNAGAEMRAFYHKALTAGKRYSGFEGEEKIFVPYGVEITKDNNVNLKSVDFAQLTNNYLRVQKKAPFKTLWNSPDDFVQDAHTYFNSHKDGNPGATGIGEAKRNAINALGNFGTAMQAETNPLISAMPRTVRPIIKSYRIDRTNQLGATGAMRPFISEDQYNMMNRNYLPGAAPEISYLPKAAAQAPAALSDARAATTSEIPIAQIDPGRVKNAYARSGDQVHWVSTNEVEKRWQGQEEAYIPPGGTENTIGKRYRDAKEYLQSSKPLNAPRISVDDTGKITFIDGRHRYAAMRDMGQENVPLAFVADANDETRSSAVENAKATGLLKR